MATLSVTSNEPTGNNSGGVTGQIQAAEADLTITKTASKTSGILDGETITYTVTVRNSGNTPSSSYTLTDPVPAAFEAVEVAAVSPASSPCTVDGNTVTCANQAALTPGATRAYTITAVAVDAEAGTHTNTATISDTTGEASEDNNSASVEVAFDAAQASLTVTKTADSETVLPEEAVEKRKWIARTALTSRVLPAIETMRLLTVLEDWEGLNALLGEKMHLMALLPASLRRNFADSWPEEMPARLRYLVHARRFLDGHTGGPLSPGIPAVLRDTVALMDGERPPPTGSLVEKVRSLLFAGILERAHERETSMKETGAMLAWLEDELLTLEGVDRQHKADTLALIGAVLISISDMSIWTGQLRQAHLAAQRVVQISSLVEMRESYDKPLRGSAMARLTFLAAVAAEPDTAKERLGLYEEVIHEVGPVDQDAERLVSIARRLMAANSPAHQMCPPAALDFEEFFPAYEALAEGMRSNLVHGEAGASWPRGIASQMHFSIWPSWVWWPVHALLALIEARDGHVTAAREWLWKVPIPEPMDLVVEAYIALADGRPQEARRMAEEVLVNPRTVQRMRLDAMGVLLSVPDPNGHQSAGILLASVDWTDALDTVALFPMKARRLILAHLGMDGSEYAGLATGAVAAGGTEPAPHLTKRQLEVLKALDSEQTMAEIAHSQYVGLETVRSTAKAIYRRLGVADRESAVEVAKALRLI